MPSIETSFQYVDFNLMPELVKASWWNVLSRISHIVTMGLDLVLANIFIGPAAAGVLAVAKTVPVYTNRITAMLYTAYFPSLTQTYAKQPDQLVQSVKQTFTFSTLVGATVMGGVIVLGKPFFTLWLPGEDATQIFQLMLVILSADFVFYGIQMLRSVFEITGHVKTLAIILTTSATITVILIIALVKLTTLGMFAIVGVNSLILTLTRIFIMLPYSARLLKVKWSHFYPSVLKELLCLGVVVLIGYGVRLMFPALTIINFIIQCLLIAAISIVVNFYILTKRAERKVWFAHMLTRFLKKQ